MNASWVSFENGKTKNTVGSENGFIIFDEESILGARITIEEKTDIAPFSITFGVYGLMFHTSYFSNFKETLSKVIILKIRIEQIISHLSIEESKRNVKWRENYNLIIDKFID
jgi:hypothetical protein